MAKNTVWTQIISSISSIFFKHQNQPKRADESLGKYNEIDPQLNIKRCGGAYFCLYHRFKLSTNAYLALGTVEQAHKTNIVVEQAHGTSSSYAHGT